MDCLVGVVSQLDCLVEAQLCFRQAAPQLECRQVKAQQEYQLEQPQQNRVPGIHYDSLVRFRFSKKKH